jgi:hypothetical protein
MLARLKALTCCVAQIGVLAHTTMLVQAEKNQDREITTNVVASFLYLCLNDVLLNMFLDVDVATNAV